MRAVLRNETGGSVTYKLTVGKRTTKYTVRSQKVRRVQTHGPVGARVVLKYGPKVIARTVVPERCRVPEVLPSTGLRLTR